MKILLTAFTFPPQANGVAEVARSQACGLAARGHDVTVATDFDPRRTEEHSFGRLKVAQFKCEGSFDPRYGYRGEIGKYQEFVATVNVDIILCNGWQVWTTDLACQVFSRSRAKKVIVSHGFNANIWRRQRRFPWGLGQWVRCLPYAWRLPTVMDLFDHLIFLSARRDWGIFFDHWLARRFRKLNLSTIPNGIHRSEPRTVRIDFRKVHGIETKHLVLNVANYRDGKNQVATLGAFLRAKRSDAT